MEASKRPASSASSTLNRPVDAAYPLSRRAREGRDAPISWLMRQALQTPGMISLAAGFVDHATLPHAELAELAAELLADPQAGRQALQYGTTPGDPALRQAIFDHLAARSPDAPVYQRLSPDDVIITSGSQQFLYLLAETLLEPGDVVITEDPSYFVMIGALENFAVRLCGVPVDADGLIPEALDATLADIDRAGLLSRVKLLYVIPYCQNPMGVTLSAERRPRFWDVFRRWRERGLAAVVAEDAAYRELRFADEDIPALFEQPEADDRICYTQSFSKVLAPGLRLGFGLAPRPLRDSLLHFKGYHDFGSGNLSQHLALRALQSGVYKRHGALLRERYRHKKDLLLHVLRDELPDEVELLDPDGGMYLWARLPAGCDTGTDSDLFRAARSENVLYVPGEMCSVKSWPGGPDDEIRAENRCAMRLCYALPDDDELVEGGKRLARAIGTVLNA